MGGFGAPDRGGSREGKKSLRGNKQVLQKLVKDEQKGHVKSAPRPNLSEKPPPALPPPPGRNALVDAAAQLASRQFDRDQFKVLQRASSSGVGPIITYTTDDSKLEALIRTAKENAGQVYCMVGVHSDNIKRSNDRLSSARLEQLKDFALEAGCVAVLAGLAFRDMGIRYAQERALSEQMELAAAVGLPLVLYEVRASEALVERIGQFRASGAGEGRAATTPIAIFNFGSSREELTTYLGLGCYIVLTGRVCDPTERGAQLRELAAAIPRDRLMLASDSPFTTPQNIPDVFVREGRNEPSNLSYVLEALAPALGMAPAELAAATRKNTLTFFGIQEASEAAATAVEAAAASVATAASTSSPAIASGKISKAGQPPPPPLAPSPRKETSDDLDLAPSGAGRRGHAGKLEESSSEEEEEDEDSGGEDEADDAVVGGQGSSARAANLFALMQLREDGEGDDVTDGEDNDGGGSGCCCCGSGRRAASGAAASTSQSGAVKRGEEAEAAGSGTPDAIAGRGGKEQQQRRLPPPRNFVAEYAAAAAAKGPVTGPRVSYSCRSCRSVLFTEADTEAHQGDERALFAANKPRKKGRGRHDNDSEASLCSMHFLREPLAWMETCLQVEGPRLAEGKLVCPTCSAKLGKWAEGPGAAGVQCSCGVVVPAPIYAVLRARLDILDAQLDIASAVQSTLKAYEEEGAGSGSSSASGGEGPGTRKKRQKQKRNKTANFSSFRNKNFGFSVKQQRQLAESVAMTAVEGAGAGGGGGGGGASGLSAARKEND